MAEFILEAEPFLGAYREEFPNILVEEITDVWVLAIARPLGESESFRSLTTDAVGADLPGPGAFTRSDDNRLKLVWMSEDQLFLIGEADREALQERLSAGAWCTEQTDNWVALRLKGGNTRAALERICPIDLDGSAFPPGSAARTVMEHMGAIIMCEERDCYVILSASSSAGSFLHAIETSIRNLD